MAAIWGFSFFFIKVGDEALSPLQVALGRMATGSAVLLLILAAQRQRLPRDIHLWGRLAVIALLLNAAPFTLFAYGEQHVTSVLAGIWNATTPLLTLLAALAILPEERPTRERVAGLAIGFFGVLIVLGVWRGLGGAALLGNLACLGAACCYGLGYPFSKRFLTSRPESGLVLSTAQLLCGTVELAVVTPFFTTMPAALPVHVALSVLCLGALGTGVAYVLNYGLIRDAGATTTSTVTYMVLLFSIAVGVLFLGERLTWYQPLGALVVVLGVATSQGRLRAGARRLLSSG